MSLSGFPTTYVCASNQVDLLLQFSHKINKYSIVLYQPEALSRCSTPLSPGGAPPLLTATPRRSSIVHADILPFFEVDLCTASKQEHVIAAVCCVLLFFYCYKTNK